MTDGERRLLILQALQRARGLGIRVAPGPMVHWSKDRQPIACDATGALALEIGVAVDGRLTSGWLASLCGYLDVDTFWLWRFWMGLDRDFQVQVWVQTSTESGEWVDDKISGWARRLAREVYV